MSSLIQLDSIQTVQLKRRKLRDQVPTSLSSNESDEPVDGPDLYFLLKDFSSASFLKYVVTETKLDVDAILFIDDFPQMNDGAQKSSLTNPVVHPLQKVKIEYLASPPESPWSQMAWLEISGTYFRHVYEYDIRKNMQT